MKRFALSAVILTCLFALPSAAAKAEMTKGEVEKIIESYLMNNGDKILKSVDDYQRKSIQQKTDASIKQNAEALFNNPRTPIAGNPDGDVTVVEFFDYNCGYCKQAFKDIKKLIENDKNVKIVFKELPILGPTSEVAAKWALAANNQGKYFAFHEKLMSHNGAKSDAFLEEAAKAVGLDVDKIKADIAGTEILLQIERERALATDMAIGGTPAFLVGEELIPGAVSYDTLKQKVDAARAAKKKQ
jgi:protein-disulfide isomerase